MSEFSPDVAMASDELSDTLPEIAEIEARWRRISEAAGAVILSVGDARGYYIGQELVSLDRELRRTTALARPQEITFKLALAESIADRRRYLGQPSLGHGSAQDEWIRQSRLREFYAGGGSGRRPRQYRSSLHGVRPDAPDTASLRLVASELGSLHLWLEPVAEAIGILASQPITALLNAAAWSGYVQRMRVWLRRKANPLEALTAREVLVVLSKSGGDAGRFLGAPDKTIEFGGPRVLLPDGTEVTGARHIQYIRREPDGAVSWLDID